MNARTIVRVSRCSPCRVCGKPDWCRVSADGGLAFCNRVPSDRPARGKGGGHLHRLVAAGTPAAATCRPPSLDRPKLSPPELELIGRRCRAALTAERLNRFAAGLGVSAASLLSLGVGWEAGRRAYTFPMLDDAGRVVGYRTRHDGGGKRCVPGGRLGLFVPAGVLAMLNAADPPDVLLVCEGESDAAAAADLGAFAIARPGCDACEELVSAFVRRLRPARVVLAADNDGPGRRGADKLARRLAAAGLAARMLVLGGAKDLRAWKALPGNDGHALAALVDKPADRTGVI
jgi:hypothetical protein